MFKDGVVSVDHLVFRFGLSGIVKVLFDIDVISFVSHSGSYRALFGLKLSTVSGELISLSLFSLAKLCTFIMFKDELANLWTGFF